MLLRPKSYSWNSDGRSRKTNRKALRLESIILSSVHHTRMSSKKGRERIYGRFQSTSKNRYLRLHTFMFDFILFCSIRETHTCSPTTSFLYIAVFIAASASLCPSYSGFPKITYICIHTYTHSPSSSHSTDTNITIGPV